MNALNSKYKLSEALNDLVDRVPTSIDAATLWSNAESANDATPIDQRRRTLLQLSLMTPNDARVWLKLARLDVAYPDACLLYLEKALQSGTPTADVDADPSFVALRETAACKALLAQYRTQTAGYLEKETETGPLQRWRRRWFVLRADRLLLFAEKDSPEPLSVVDLSTIALLSRSRSVVAVAVAVFGVSMLSYTLAVTSSSNPDRSGVRCFAGVFFGGEISCETSDAQS